MRKLTLLTSVLLASSFQTVNVSAQCMNTINCQTLGYTKTSCTKGGVKCPTGNYWYCPESQCDSSYQYTCTGYMQSPSGTACNGKYQKCNCSNNYVWNASQGLCLACTSLCTGYTLTYKQAVQQCGSSNAFACLDNCTGNRLYKCGTNTGSGSGSGSGSSQCQLGGLSMSVGDMTCRSTSRPEVDWLSRCDAGDINGNGNTVKIAPVVSTSACVAGYDAGSGNIQTALSTCSNLKVNGVTGWYLPSDDLLAAIDKEYGLNGTYWSSSRWGTAYYLTYNGSSHPDQNASYKIFCVHDLPG